MSVGDAVCLSVCLQVMLVSLRAGGVGLNLIGGNHLFLLDMHWSVDDYNVTISISEMNIEQNLRRYI